MFDTCGPSLRVKLEEKCTRKWLQGWVQGTGGSWGIGGKLGAGWLADHQGGTRAHGQQGAPCLGRQLDTRGSEDLVTSLQRLTFTSRTVWI